MQAGKFAVLMDYSEQHSAFCYGTSTEQIAIESARMSTRARLALLYNVHMWQLLQSLKRVEQLSTRYWL